MDLPILGGNKSQLMSLGMKEEDLKTQWPLVMMGIKNKAMQGDVKATQLLLELVEKENKMVQLKEKELKLKERELLLKEKLLESNTPDDERITIINDIPNEDD